jgi:hypothetical protein
VLYRDKVIELHLFGFGKGLKPYLMPLLGLFGQKSQLAGNGDAGELQEQGDATLGDTGTEQLGHLGIGPAFILKVGGLKRGSGKVALAA